MMSRGTLWRYIAKRFAIAICIAFFVCFVLIFLVDFIEILRQAGKRGSVPLHQLVWMTLLRMPAFADLTIPFAALVGTIGVFLKLSRSSELTVMRASGMSVWQLLVPAIVTASIIGALAVTLFNPLAATARAESERLRAELFDRNVSIVQTRAGAWLQQESVDGRSVIEAQTSANHGVLLGQVVVLQYDAKNRFVERIEADKAVLREGYWLLENALVTRPGQASEIYGQYHVSTHLDPTHVRDAFGSLLSVSFWRLPRFIELARTAGVSSAGYEVQYAGLLVKPAMLVAMVLLGATVSLRLFRFGGVQTMVLVGVTVGLVFFVAVEVARQFGAAGLAPAALAAGGPVAIAILLSLTALLHLEDG